MSSEARPPARDEPPEPDALLGRTLSTRYRIESLLARGGMARVYRARDERLARDVAVKVLARPYSDDPAFTERFLEEARAAASISHPSIAHVYDSGSDGDAHYIVMELLDGHRTLRRVLEERGRLPVPEALRIGQELLGGLRAVHERGLVHCDVKAANVMLGPGQAKLIDFGIARPPHDGTGGDTSIGTLQSMSPEQLHGEALTPASDLFSLGTVLYEAVTGRVPYPGRTPEEVSEAHRSRPPGPPSAHADGIPPRLDDAILQSLRRDPRARFHTADAMSRALEIAAAGAPPPSEDETQLIPAAQGRGGYVPPQVAPPPDRPSGPPPRRGRRRRPNPWGIFGTLAILAAAALVVLLVVLPLLDTPAEPGASQSPVASAPAGASSAAPGTVAIPDVVGRPTDEAIDQARDAGLNWRLECAENQALPEGIIDQEPPPGTQVQPGARFTMYSARIADCR